MSQSNELESAGAGPPYGAVLGLSAMESTFAPFTKPKKTFSTLSANSLQAARGGGTFACG